MGQQEATNLNNENFFTQLALKVATALTSVMPNVTTSVIAEMYKNAPKMDKSIWVLICDQWVENKYLDRSTADFLKTAADQPFPIGWLFQIIAPVVLYLHDFKNAIAIGSMSRQYHQMAQSTPNPAPVDALVRSMMIDPARATENRAELKKHGFNDLQIDNIILSQYRLYDEGTIRTAYLRGIIDETKMFERMRELGFTDTRIKEIVQTWELLPSPQDLFTMVAHEAFEPDIYTKLGLNEEFPTEQVEWLKKQGISEDWARKFWIAHWEQPSIGQGFEMLHRGVIGLPELDMLFRAVEIPSYWRDKLTKIAYQPYTRVDVRRMHELGIINDSQLIKSFLDLGYDAEHALNMANFTIRYNEEGQTQLTRSAILESYREGLISHNDAKDLLTTQDYSEDLAEYYLTLEDYNRDKDVQKLRLDNLRDKYLLGLISENQLKSALNQAGFLGNKIDALIEEYDIQKYKYQVLPSKSELINWLIKGIINEQEFTETLIHHGYSWRHVQMYLKDIENERLAEGRTPTKADLDRWMKKGLISLDQYSRELRALGYSNRYIEIYKKEV